MESLGSDVDSFGLPMREGGQPPRYVVVLLLLSCPGASMDLLELKLRMLEESSEAWHSIVMQGEDSLPAPLWTYLTARLYCTEVATCLAIAQACETACHERLTRMLKGPWSGQTLLDLALRPLFTLGGGDLMVDDTRVEKPYAALLEEAAWGWSMKHNKGVFGLPGVLLVWTNGQLRMPLAFRVWRQGGPSKFDLALELLSDARNRLKLKRRFVLFAAW
jgi:hypothetical protein